MSESLTSSQLKNRLLGAFILVLAAVLLIPLFLGEAKQGDSNSALADAKEQSFQSKVQPLPSAQGFIKQKDGSNFGDNSNGNEDSLVLQKIDQLRPVKRVKSVLKPLTQTKKTKQAPVAPVKKEAISIAKAKARAKAKPVKKAKATPKSQPKPVVKSATKSAIKSGWVVQAGTFSKPENAKAIVKVLKSNGHAPKTSQTKASFGKATRVWLGPFAKKDEAIKVSKRIEKQTGNGGFIASYPFKS